LTKDNLAHRGWIGDERCRFCSQEETIDHLFFQCGIAKFVWNVVFSALNCPNIPTKLEKVCDWMLTFKDLKVRQFVAIGIVSVIWGLRKIRNKACFQHIYPVDPNGIIVYIYQLQLSWIALQKKNLFRTKASHAQL
jgi:hypothetical protein